MSMVEKVTRAICLAANDGKTDEGWPMYEGMARAAIEAMKDPTERMTEVGRSHNYNLYADPAYIAMIDAALKEQA